MTSVLGMKAECAERLLIHEGYEVTYRSLSARKAMEGDDQRVIRERELERNRIVLTVSSFMTTPK